MTLYSLGSLPRLTFFHDISGSHTRNEWVGRQWPMGTSMAPGVVARSATRSFWTPHLKKETSHKTPGNEVRSLGPPREFSNSQPQKGNLAQNTPEVTSIHDHWRSSFSLIQRMLILWRLIISADKLKHCGVQHLNYRNGSGNLFGSKNVSRSGVNT